MKGITLIGMPGSGKSTIGKLLADKLSRNFIDLDILIKEKEGRSHVEVIEKNGERQLLNLEEKYTLGLSCENLIFAPGGSIIYSPKATEKLYQETIIFYLHLPIEEIKNRLGEEIGNRGIVGLKEKGLEKLFQEREILYKKFAHKIIDCSGLNKNEIIYEILQH